MCSSESKSEVAQLCPTLCNAMDCSLPSFSVHGIFQARVLEWVAISFSRGSSRPRDSTQVLLIVGRCFYRLSHQGSPKNIGVGCHFLLQEIFLTQGLNPGLPRCRQTLYQLSHQETEIGAAVKTHQINKTQPNK